MSYELFQQRPAAYIPVLLLSLVITVVAYGAFPFIFARVRNTPSTKKKYRRLCYGINIAVMFMFIVINGEASSGGPYLLWTWIFSSWGTRILENKGLLDDGTYIPSARFCFEFGFIYIPPCDLLIFYHGKSRTQGRSCTPKGQQKNGRTTLFLLK